LLINFHVPLIKHGIVNGVDDEIQANSHDLES